MWAIMWVNDEYPQTIKVFDDEALAKEFLQELGEEHCPKVFETLLESEMDEIFDEISYECECPVGRIAMEYVVLNK